MDCRIGGLENCDRRTDDDKSGAEKFAKAESFVSKERPREDGYYGNYEGRKADQPRCDVLKKPEIKKKSKSGTENGQI